jgi:hypothetical protein
MAYSLLTQSFEELANGTTITTGNTGNPSAPFDAISALSSGQTLASDNTHVQHGSMALKVATGVTSATCYADWSTSFAWQAQNWFRIYLYMTANPGAAMNLLTFLQSGTSCGRIRIGTTGKVIALDSAGATQLTSTNSITLNAYVRIEGYLTGNASTGQIEFKLFNTPDSTTATETQTSGASLNTTGTPNTSRWGLAQAVASTGQFWFDDLGLSTFGYLGVPSAVTDTETGSGADAGETITLNGVETSSGVDTSVAIGVTTTDTGSGFDTGSVNHPVSADSGAFTDVGVVVVSDADVSQTAENPTTTGVASTDTGSGADTGAIATQAAISSTDTGSFTEAARISFAQGAGGGPGFPLIFQMASGAITPGVPGDSGMFTESQSIQVVISDHDFGVFADTQNFPGGKPAPTSFQVEGFSITHAGVLLPGVDPSQGTLYGVRSAQIAPQWVTTVSQLDDQVVSVWNAPGSVQATIQAGFMPWDVLAALAGTTVSSSGAAPADYYSLPLFRQHVTGQLPLILRASGKDAAGNQRAIQFLAYAAQFGPVTFDGPVYKNGLTASYTVTLLLSSADETGQALPDRAYGRVMSLPAGSAGWVPSYHTPIQVRDSDSGSFTETGIAGPTGGTQFVSDSDGASFSEGQRVSTGTQHILDTDSGSFTETRQVAGPVVLISDTDHFTTRPRQGLVGCTTFQGEYGAPTNRLDSANQFNTLTGREMATTFQKIYYQPGQFPTTFSSVYAGLVATGCDLWLCYAPAYDGSDAVALAASLAALQAAAVGNVKAVWYQEPQDVQTGWPTGPQFIQTSQNYYSVAQALGIPVIYNSAAHAGPTGVTSYFPVVGSNVYCDETALDYYCYPFTHMDSANGTTALALEALARKYGQLPFGFGELGTALNATDAATVTVAQFTAYINFIISLMVGRLETGQFNSDIGWFNGDNTGAPTWNTITSSSDYRVPLLVTLADTLSRVKAGFPARDGGGEAPTGPVPRNGALGGGFTNTRCAQLVAAVSSPPTSCPVSVTDWLTHGNPAIGPLDAIKMFYSGTQVMDTFQNGHLGSDNESQLPQGIVPFITYKDSQISGLAQYVASIPDDREVWLSYWQEAEDTYPGGSYTNFIKTFIQCSQIIRSVGKANVKIFQNSAGSPYATVGSAPQQGLWQVPPEHVDAYTVDSYQRASLHSYPSAGLANYQPWLNWLGVYASSGRPVGITEYGISNATPGQRNTRLQQDAAYLRTAFPGPAGGPGAVSPFPLLLWLYWWSDCSGGSIGAFANQFTDSATIATWQQIGSGAL